MSLVQGYWRKKIEIIPLLTSDEPKEPQQLEFKPLPVELKYTFLEENRQCQVVVSSLLTASQEHNLLHLLKRNKQALGWKISYLKGLNSTICTHHIYLEEESKAVRQPQRRWNPHLQEVVHIEVLKLLQAGIIYPISDSTWVSPTQVVPKESGVTTMKNEKGEELSTRLTTGWRVCIDYRRLNEVTRKYHFPLPFIDQLLKRVSGHPFYCFMVNQGIVLGHVISSKGIEVDKAKIELISKLPSPKNVKPVRQFLGHAGFYRRFIKDFSKIAKPLYKLLEKVAKFFWEKEF